MKPVKNENGKYVITPSFCDSGITTLKSDHEKSIRIKELSESEKSIKTIETYLKKFSPTTVYTLCMMDSIKDSIDDPLRSTEWSFSDWQKYMEVFWKDI